MAFRDHIDAEQDQAAVFEAELRELLETARQELEEIALMGEQSQLEVNKLAQKNAAINAQLQQVQEQYERLPREDIRTAYNGALDAQQRLFVMRGQTDKLQSDRGHLERYIELLERVLKMLESGAISGGKGKGAGAPVETLEMLIQAQEAERLRLSRQMHDGPAQALSNFILQTEIAMRLFDMDQAKAREELEQLKGNSTTAFQQVRDFIFDLRPMMLDDLGLIPTLKRYVEAYGEKSGAEVRLGVIGTERRFESYLEVMIFRAVQELLGNAVHMRNANQVKIQVDIDPASVKVDVDDNGRGFELDELESEGGMGLKVIKDRVEMLGGFFSVSSANGQGGQVNFHVPTSKTS
ncbi:MAG TPA: histidine kinase [Anaerolineales bacterium]